MHKSLEHAGVSWTGQPVRRAGRDGGRGIAALDPRTRIMLALALAAAVVAASGLAAKAAGLAVAVGLARAARLARRPTLKRLLAVDLFVVAMVVMLPFTTPGTPLLTLGPLVASVEGLVHAVAIGLTANAVVLALLALVGTMDAVTLGHALARLGAPARLVEILMITVRYLDVIGREYRRMRTAMKARAFRLAGTLHGWRSIGYLLGMLLVRSLERAERVAAAMKCRGYRGRLPLIDRLRFGPPDRVALAVGLTLAVLAVGLDRLAGA